VAKGHIYMIKRLCPFLKNDNEVYTFKAIGTFFNKILLCVILRIIGSIAGTTQKEHNSAKNKFL